MCEIFVETLMMVPENKLEITLPDNKPIELVLERKNLHNPIISDDDRYLWTVSHYTYRWDKITLITYCKIIHSSIYLELKIY